MQLINDFVFKIFYTKDTGKRQYLLAVQEHKLKLVGILGDGKSSLNNCFANTAVFCRGES